MSKPAGSAPRATIRDVAAQAGVSKSLVSLAFKDASRVGEARLRRIREAAEELGYQPNFLARSLAAEGSPFIGIVVVDLRNPLFADIADAARAEFDAQGQYGLITSASVPGVADEGERYGRVDDRVMAMLQDLRPRALLVIGTVADASALPSGIPIVYASAAPEAGSGHASVRVDDRAGMELLFEHLTERGHRRIAFVGGEGGGVSRSRREAYAASCRARGLEELVFPASYSEREGAEAGARLLRAEPRPTAAIAVNDLAALGVQAAAERAGLELPRELAVAGFDNTYLAGLPRISLTSVDPCNAEIGRLAARRILSALQDPTALGGDELVRPGLVVRASTRSEPGGARPVPEEARPIAGSA
jgi:DNA-binding LacI/PurR family transcriptional regulator